MRPRIRPYGDQDAEAVVDLSLRAWAPVFASLERVLGSEVFESLNPKGWRESQRQAVEAVLAAEKTPVWVAEAGAGAVGFVALELDHPERGMGEISMLAVDPGYQGAGIGTVLTEFALDRLKDAGMKVAMVETGGDPGHAAAHVREGRLRPPADSQVLQEAVATPGKEKPRPGERPGFGVMIRLPKRWERERRIKGVFGCRTAIFI